MRVILATGIFYPDVGGPAIHVRKIGEALVRQGHKVTVIAYGNLSGEENFGFDVVRVSRKYPSPVRWLRYFLELCARTPYSDALYAFNLTTAGLPVFLAGKMFRKKILIRVAGDPIWERIVENGHRFMPISDYYSQDLAEKDKKLVFRLIKYILPRFNSVIFYTPLLRGIYCSHYGVPEAKTQIVPNPVSKRSPVGGVKKSTDESFLFAGRFVSYKNLELLINSFNQIRNKFGRGSLVLVGDGPDKNKLNALISQLRAEDFIRIIPKMDQDSLFRLICSSTLGMGPALTEFNPNFILECLSFGRPVLISKENGLTVSLSAEFVFDPKDGGDLEKKLAQFFDPEFLKQAEQAVSDLAIDQTWEKVTDFHVKLLENIITS